MTKVTTICGSMRFFGEMLEVAEEWTLRGEIVLMPFVTVDSDECNDVKKMLDNLHLNKIAMSDNVLVVTNSKLYTGESTKREIEFAISLRKHVEYVFLTDGYGFVTIEQCDVK